MTLSQRKKAWVDSRVKDLRKSGLTDAAIARRMGVSPSTFNEAIKSDGVSDGFVQKLADAYGIPFTLADSSGKPERGGTITVDAKQFGELVDQVKLQTRLLNAVLDRLEKESK